MTSYNEAVDINYATFHDAWISGASPIFGFPEVEYDEPPADNHAELSAVFVRVSMSNVIEGQMTIGTHAETGGNEYETVGLLMVQILVPRIAGNTVAQGRALAALVRDAYRRAGANGEVWYTEETITEPKPEKRWRQFNVTVRYSYTETT